MTNRSASLMETAVRLRAEGAANAARAGALPVARAKIDGKFFARGGQRMQLHGVTYGPFAPDADGHQFPSRERVRDDFFGMAEGGINAIRTYHVPPEWLLNLADQEGVNVFIDV